MDVSKLRIHGVNALVTIIALTIGAGTMRASNALLAAPAVSGAVTCATLTGLGTSATIVVKPAGAPAAALTGSAAVTVTVVGTPLANGTGTTLANGLVVTPLSYTLSSTNATAGVTFTVTAAPGCASLGVGAPLANTVQFYTSKVNPTVSGANDTTATVNSTLTVNGSPLVAAAITVSCGRNGTGPYTYTPSGSLATISVTSAAVGGTPFTVTGGSLPAWLSVSSLNGGTATSTPVTFTAQAVSPCNTLAPGNSTSSTITLASTQGLSITVGVTITVVQGTPLTATPTSVSMSHVKGSGTAQTSTVSVTSSGLATYFTVNTATLPIWLTVNTTYGIAPASLTFSTTTVADTMPPGTYNSTVYLQVYGQGDLPIPVTLFLTNSAPKLSISSANPLAITWVQGAAPPTATITAISSDSPIPYSITTAGTLGPIVSAVETAGLAYNFGTNIAVTFPAQVYQTVQPGTVLTGTVSFTWGSPATITVVTINLTVAAPGASLSTLSPATVPTGTSGTQFPITLSGGGFVGGANPATSTKVGIVVGGVLVADSNISLPTVVNASEMYVTITVPATTDALLPFSPTGAGGPVVLGVCNGSCIGSTVAASAQFTLNIGVGPVIQGVTSSSTFTEVTPPALPSIAPYDMISIFGVNFCSSVGTGCTTSTILTGGATGAALVYPFFLSPDAAPVGNATDTRRKLTVNFYAHGGPYNSGGAAAPLLFATNGQINAMVPGGLTPATPYDIIVSFNCSTCTPATTLNSAPFEVNIVTSDPGVFTVGADGQGGAAALENSNYSLITSANPAGVRSTGTDSDILQLYMTGLGAPTSTGTNLSAGTTPPTVPTDCIGPLVASGAGSYEAALETATGLTLSNIDGTIIQSVLLNTNDLPPCFTTEPAVTIGGVAGTVTYAGFVPDSIAGLYQVDVKLPVSTNVNFTTTAGVTGAITGTPVQLPVQVTINSVNSQSGVTMWVVRKLHVVAPSVLQGQVGVAWSGSNNAVIATEGSGTYSYNITSGVLPIGLSFTSGAISGTPAANSGGSYTVTVTATDTSSPVLSDSVTFTLVITAPLTVTQTGSSPFHTTFGTASPTVTTVSASAGQVPYTYTLTSPAGEPTITVGASSGVLGTTAATPAGTYPITVHATDSSNPAEYGNDSFSLVVALAMSNTAPVAQTHGTSAVVTTVTATGNTGTIVYTLDATSVSNGFTVTSSGQVEPTTVASSGPYTVTVTATDSVTMPTGANAFGTGSTAALSITLN